MPNSSPERTTALRAPWGKNASRTIPREVASSTKAFTSWPATRMATAPATGRFAPANSGHSATSAGSHSSRSSRHCDGGVNPTVRQLRVTVSTPATTTAEPTVTSWR
jgi:hypothetical protein